MVMKLKRLKWKQIAELCSYQIRDHVTQFLLSPSEQGMLPSGHLSWVVLCGLKMTWLAN
jgi:hypothetical protein